MDVSWSNMGGIGRFTDEIARRLPDISLKKIYKKCASPIAPLGLAINIALLKKADLVFLPGYIPPLFSSKRYIVTIHDLNHLDIDDNSSFFKKLFLINTVCSLMLHQPAKTFFVAADTAVDLVCMTIFQLVYPVRISQ